ncbi:MAG: hypothetical protein M1827_004815 [Pycnora praestabilis]|nr:MAG: hypothetical protein M1827_004815 [Pycnora praestabilis]
MPLVRKRRAEAGSPSPSASSDSESEVAPTSRNTQKTPQRRRRREDSSEDEVVYSGNEDGGTQGDGIGQDQMVKKMVRLALASEYARQPIRRVEIGLKVLGTHGRQSRVVFDEAQRQLRDKFGMEMIELPIKEKVTISQRRAAQKVDKASASSKAWILTSILPPKYHTNTSILLPPKVPTSTIESTYTALYTFIISVISLSGGALPEAKLERYLKRTNADQYTPIDKTEKLLARSCKEGYLVKVKDSSSGEEIIEYMVGPRGKVEIGDDGVSGLVKTVYGNNAVEDLDRRIQRSLGIDDDRRRKKNVALDGTDGASSGVKDPPARSKRRDNERDEEENPVGSTAES